MPRGDSLAWHVHIPAELGLNMDPHDFGEVVGNLLDNARKWAETTVTIRVEPVSGKARITIEDDGPGFDGTHVPANHGIALVRDRLAATLGSDATLRIESRTGLSAVVIDLPASRS